MVEFGVQELYYCVITLSGLGQGGLVADCCFQFRNHSVSFCCSACEGLLHSSRVAHAVAVKGKDECKTEVCLIEEWVGRSLL